MIKNILYIVEGEKSEPDLLKRLWDRFKIDVPKEVYVYNTNIHVLIEQLFINESLDEDLDILRTLSSSEKNQEKKSILTKKYTDVYLIFDLDPQDRSIDISKLEKMMIFFNDSADNGKLYLNYPMVESYRHIVSATDTDFKDRCIPVKDSKKYKSIVNEECWSKLKQLTKYDRDVFTEIIKMHLGKLNYILNNEYTVPNKEYFYSLNGTELLQKQIKTMNDDKKLYVINTCIFCVVEYNPKLFFDVKPIGEISFNEKPEP